MTCIHGFAQNIILANFITKAELSYAERYSYLKQSRSFPIFALNRFLIIASKRSLLGSVLKKKTAATFGASFTELLHVSYIILWADETFQSPFTLSLKISLKVCGVKTVLIIRFCERQVFL